MVSRSSEQSNEQLVSGEPETTNPNLQQQSGLFTEGDEIEQITNVQFIKALYRQRPKGSKVAVCTKSGDPTEGGWAALRAVKRVKLLPKNNNYGNWSTFYPVDDVDFNVKKENFAALHVIVLDDVGTKIPLFRLNGAEPTWVIETSPGNYQFGFGLKEPITDLQTAESLIKTVIDAGLSDKGMSGVSRWFRLPRGINGKTKYLVDDKPFECRLVYWSQT